MKPEVQPAETAADLEQIPTPRMSHDKADRIIGTVMGVSFEAASIGGVITKAYASAAFCAALGAGVLISTYPNEVREFIDKRIKNR